jgi:dUTP pyrophosphatase
MLKSRSGMNTKHGITSTGVVDEGYVGPIKVALHNDSNEEYVVKRGDRVTQLVVIPVLYEDVELVDEIEGGERGENGYGSTGR